MKVQPYLMFDGRCEEALEFYKGALNAEVNCLMRFKENPGGCMTPGTEEKVMHAQFKIGDSELFCSDGMCKSATRFEGITLSIIADNVGDAESKFQALGVGGQVQMPLEKTFFAERFGMVADKFGVSWMLLAY